MFMYLLGHSCWIRNNSGSGTRLAAACMDTGYRKIGRIFYLLIKRKLLKKEEEKNTLLFFEV